MPIVARPRRARGRTAALAALTVAGTALIGAPAAAAPGDNGDVKIHENGTPFDDQRDESKVCDFYLAAFGFDQQEDVSWSIDPQGQGPNAGAGHLEGDITTDDQGAAHTVPLGLPNGLYKLTWKTADGNGAGKFKVFTVDCASPKPTPSMPGGGPGGPNGGPPAGGGGLARDAAMGPVAGAAVVGLAAVGGAVWLRLRRRPHGAS
ncbi:hypothetical protein DI272_39160 [Streptomyces sp. Act143]|uniref:hypothetical protein n=1 Tax=Streptomyces sp. Act143 TaxID=2200760 RepID=UPI000D679C17|nr:hypothetical protein [Streptomyces sp. Act143]PWI19512.1 hypothetical protein DI272_39160 [Streptomyces sp. Act143]